MPLARGTGRRHSVLGRRIGEAHYHIRPAGQKRRCWTSSDEMRRPAIGDDDDAAARLLE